MASTPPPPAPRPRVPPDDLTRDDLRSLRRWVLVAGVWAVAATAIALIALLDRSDSEARKEADAVERRLKETTRKTDARTDDLEKRLNDLPRSEDISKLQERLTRVENDAAKAAADTRGAEKKLTSLTERVQEVEDNADSGAAEDTDPGANEP